MRTLRPAGRPFSGTLALPGDKSIAHRALILGALAEGGLRVRNLPQGLDVRCTAQCLRELGVEIRDKENEVQINGCPDGRLKRPSGRINCNNSGTTMRLLMGLLSGQDFETVLTGDASLSRRPMDRVAEPLRLMGATVALTDGRAPVRVSGPQGGLKALRYRLSVPSAQVKSAVLLAGLFAQGETVVEDPFGTRDHTERMLAWLGAGTLEREGQSVRLKPGRLRGGRAMTLPADLSTAAFFAAAASIVPGSEVVLERVGLNPTRTGFLSVLKRMGASVQTEAESVVAGEPVGRLKVCAAPLRAVQVAAEEVPSLIDEVPLVAVLAARAEGESRLEGLQELRVKESDRLSATAEGLQAMGADARIEGSALVVRGPARLQGARIETRGDHRMAMAFAVAALAAEGETVLSDAECAAVSFPGFYDAMEGLLR